VGLSVSSLSRHFRAATSMSPLRYQKQLRPQRVRLRLLAGPADVAGAGHAVGYTSASQFSREYRRLFGAPRDAPPPNSRTPASPRLTGAAPVSPSRPA